MRWRQPLNDASHTEHRKHTTHRLRRRRPPRFIIAMIRVGIWATPCRLICGLKSCFQFCGFYFINVYVLQRAEVNHSDLDFAIRWATTSRGGLYNNTSDTLHNSSCDYWPSCQRLNNVIPPPAQWLLQNEKMFVERTKKHFDHVPTANHSFSYG